MVQFAQILYVSFILFLDLLNGYQLPHELA